MTIDDPLTQVLSGPRPPAAPREPRACTLAYGPAPDQAGELYLPEARSAPLVCLFHGGFWRMPHGRDQLVPLAEALARRGFAVWNVGYRRVGEGGSPYPATLEDVLAAFDHLPAIREHAAPLELRGTFVTGHSAGGHLAFWAAAQAAGGRIAPLSGVVGLAPILNLPRAHRLDLGAGAVALFLGGSPQAHPRRYAEASPSLRLPLRTPQCILHGGADTVVPPDGSESHATTARNAGDTCDVFPLPGLGHMDVIDPSAASFAVLCDWITARAASPA